jgi:hypothetical protein
MLGPDEKDEACMPSEREGNDDIQAASSRLPYQPPRLRHLGSVRRLTLASTGPNNDFSFNRHKH